MDSDQFDIDVPDTIPAYITRRHQKVARRTVARAYASASALRRRHRMSSFVAVVAVLALIAGVVAMWTIWPSPTTFVVVPTIVLVAGVCGVTFSVVRKAGLDRL